MSDRRCAVLSGFMHAARNLDEAITAQKETVRLAHLNAHPKVLLRAIAHQDDLRARWRRLWKRSDDEAERIRYVQ